MKTRPTISTELVRCTRCGEVLNGKAIRWLEGDHRDGTYHKLGSVPQQVSQGAFPFGAKCAKVELGETLP